MPDMMQTVSPGMTAFYTLELRDWKAASALKPATGVSPQSKTQIYWAQTIAEGHLHQPQLAAQSLATYRDLLNEIRRGKSAYLADSTAEQVRYSEMLAWTAFAGGDTQQALTSMRAAADLQDKVGQAEVDIPAREMLADMLLESNQPATALAEYQRALELSPNRFNGLYHAGLAAEQSGDKPLAAKYYASLMKTTANGTKSTRAEFTHMKEFVANTQVANTR
jgi:tetratricopeptide (TPR) repeat protein